MTTERDIRNQIVYSHEEGCEEGLIEGLEEGRTVKERQKRGISLFRG
ncbi:MAG: hypothetical protein IKI00_07425 [Bacteroidales bacterium]|nr:hypothetical protein [Bacteroidales bacterium]